MTRCGPNRWTSRPVLRREGATCPAVGRGREHLRRVRRPRCCGFGERDECPGT
ncbi:hypothetical protein [Streptosporangium sp. NPDC050855]|uniref:hypothetical protein n=1 Tax=Streptosporangium TaxID=2000 RepID=UPI00379B04E4